MTADASEGNFPVTFTLTDHTTGAALSGATLRVAVAKAGELWPYDTNEGIYRDRTRFSGGFDSDGWACSQNVLSTAGCHERLHAERGAGVVTGLAGARDGERRSVRGPCCPRPTRSTACSSR